MNSWIIRIGRPEAASRVPNVWRLCGIPHKRHSFALRCLLGWYRCGTDVAAQLPRLSTYLGHRNPADTYWYLTATPELLALAARRLENSQEARP
jgi:integrase